MRKADNLPPYCAVVKKSRNLNFLDSSGPAWPVTGVLYLYLFESYIGVKQVLWRFEVAALRIVRTSAGGRNGR